MTGVLQFAANYAICIGLATGITGRYFRPNWEDAAMVAMMILLAIGNGTACAAAILDRNHAGAWLNGVLGVIALALLATAPRQRNRPG